MPPYFSTIPLNTNGSCSSRPVCSLSSYADLLGLFLILLHFDNFTTFVKSTIGTYGMREAHRAAIGTGSQVARLQRVVGTAHIAAALGMFALWMWGH